MEDPLGFSKRTREGTSLVNLLACKGFYKVERNLKNRKLLGGLDVGTSCFRTSIKFLCLSSSSLHSLIFVVYF